MENIGYIVFKMYLNTPYSLYAFQILPNVITIY
jgi:hypothetical protein